MSDTTCVSCGPDLDVEEALDGEACPECGSIKYEPVEGCTLCRDCGYSPCK